MTYVLRLSTDNDILNTRLNAAWNPINGNYTWAQVQHGGLGIPGGARIVVIAHGNGQEIGNASPGRVDITPEAFLVLIHTNMAAGTRPAAIYLSTCGPGIAEFTARVRLAAEHNQIWHGVHLYGHHDPQSGPVQPPNAHVWTQIF